MNMREMILAEIVDMRDRERGFERGSMRWNRWWFHPDKGVQDDPGKKYRSGYCHLSMVSNELFEDLPDDLLLNSFIILLRTSFKQM